MAFITSKTLGVWSSNAHLLTVVFVPLVSIGDAFRSFGFCQEGGKKRENNSECFGEYLEKGYRPVIRSAVTTLGLSNLNAPHACGFSHYLEGRECVCFQNCGIMYFSCEC